MSTGDYLLNHLTGIRGGHLVPSLMFFHRSSNLFGNSKPVAKYSELLPIVKPHGNIGGSFCGRFTEESNIFLRSDSIEWGPPFSCSFLNCELFTMGGLVSMAVWAKVLPLTASCLSQLSGFKYHQGYVRKMPVNWGYVVVFSGYSCFLHEVQLSSHDVV